jgi:hypothetical protein
MDALLLGIPGRGTFSLNREGGPSLLALSGLSLLDTSAAAIQARQQLLTRGERHAVRRWKKLRIVI